MSDPYFRDKYARILAELASADATRQAAGTPERRGAPRIPVGSADVIVNLEHAVSPADVSTSGIHFLSDRPFPVDREITFTVASVFSVEAIVVDCTMVETDPDLLEVRYHVRCKFEDEKRGVQFVVMLKQNDALA